MATGLQKITVEVPFIKGQLQKFAQEVSEMDTPYFLRNVDMRKGSALTKRVGHSAMTSSYDGAVSFVSASPKRLVSVDGELVALTEAAGSIGSGGGAGSSGDTVFAFAETAQKWKAFGKMQRPTLEVLNPISAHRESVGKIDCSVHGRYMLTVEQDGISPNRSPGLFVTITDLESNTERLQTLIGGDTGDKLIKCIATTTYLAVVWYNASVGTFHVTKWVPATLAQTQHDFLVGSSTGADNADVAVSADLAYVSYTEGGTLVRVVPISVATGTAGSPVTVATFAAGTQKPTAATISGAELLVGWVDPTTSDVKVRTGTLTPTFPDAALTVASATLAEEVRVVIVSSTVRLVFWETPYDDSTETSYTGGDLVGSGTAASIYWARVEGTSSTLALGWGGAARRSLNVAFWGQPFVLESRVFLPVVGVRALEPGGSTSILGAYVGAYMTEVEPTISSSQATLMPHAACMLDVAASALGRNTQVVTSKAYIAGTRFRTDPGDPAQRIYRVEFHQALVCVFNFADAYRWKPAVHDHMVIFGGAFPYVYDGKSTHECGFAWRPEIAGYVVDTGGSLSSSETYSYRVTFEYRDARGKRWMSQPSNALEAESIDDPTGTDLTLKFSVPTLSLNMMQDAGFYFPGPLYAVLWRATAANANSGTYIRDTAVQFHPYDTANITLTSSAADSSIAAAERLYILGGELENYPAPPCHVLFQHRDRLLAYNDEWGTIDYTKPLQADRGIEWSLAQRIPAPEKIVAGESLEHIAIFFSGTKIYGLEGAGPSSTGVPPDAFARLVLINADIGCSEVNAAWRCPAGIIFRSEGGFWLLDRSLSVKYLGAPVESDFDYLRDSSLSALCGVVDEKNNCMRIYCDGQLQDIEYNDDFTSSLTRFNYWFDTGRWSVDTLQCTDPAWATYHRGKNYIIWGNQSQSGIAYEDSTTKADLGSFYPEVIETSWIRFGDLTSFKRVWRVLASLEKQDEDDSSALSIVTCVNFDRGTPASERLFANSEIGADGPKFLRVHMPKQKVRAVKVALIERQTLLDDTGGFKFHGIGFELGMKRGAFKAATVSR